MEEKRLHQITIPITWLIYDRENDQLLHMGIHKDVTPLEYRDIRYQVADLEEPEGEFILSLANVAQVVLRTDDLGFYQLSNKKAENIEVYRAYNKKIKKAPNSQILFDYASLIKELLT